MPSANANFRELNANFRKLYECKGEIDEGVHWQQSTPEGYSPQHEEL